MGVSRLEQAVAPAGASQRAGQHDYEGAPGPGHAGHASRLRFAAGPEAAALTLADIQPRDNRYGASSIGSASMARVRAPMPILSRSQTRLTGGGMLRSEYRRKRLWCLESALITDFSDGYIPYYICSA